MGLTRGPGPALPLMSVVHPTRNMTFPSPSLSVRIYLWVFSYIDDVLFACIYSPSVPRLNTFDAQCNLCTEKNIDGRESYVTHEFRDLFPRIILTWTNSSFHRWNTQNPSELTLVLSNLFGIPTHALVHINLYYICKCWSSLVSFFPPNYPLTHEVYFLATIRLRKK